MNTMLAAAVCLAVATMNVKAQTTKTMTGHVPAPPSPPSIDIRPPMAPRININMNEDERDFKDLKSKEISVQVPAAKAADIYIENTQRTIIVKTWGEQKVKVTTTVYYEGDGTKVTDEEWFEKLNLSVKALGNSIRVKSGTVSSSGSYTTNNGTFNWSSGSGGVAIFNSDGENIGTKSNTKRYVTIYIPEGNRLDIESKYSDISLSNNVGKFTADITNGSLEMQDATTFTLRSKYANVVTGNIKTAEVEFINGRFTAKDIEDLDIDTKYSTIELASVKKINIRSTNDDYEMDEAGAVQGRKNYGNLRINKLNNSIEMDGTNADVKVRNISTSVDVIRFDNKYADIRLPLRNLKNYTVNYVGPYSNVYANFEKKPLVVKEGTKDAPKEKEEKDEVTREVNRAVERAFKTAEAYSGQNTIESKFTATVGNGRDTKIDMKCQNCTVDFK